MYRNKGFTLIELMISITIIAILSMISYAPYNYYQNKNSLKVTTREVSQLLYEARNMAINGAIGTSGNVSIGVYFDSDISNNIKIKVYSYPHDLAKSDIQNIDSGNILLVKTLYLKKGVIVDKVEEYKNVLFYFESITGKISYYNWDSGVRKEFSDDILSINFSFKGSKSPNLNKLINYYTKTNIIDY